MDKTQAPLIQINQTLSTIIIIWIKIYKKKFKITLMQYTQYNKKYFKTIYIKDIIVIIYIYYIC